MIHNAKHRSINYLTYFQIKPPPFPQRGELGPQSLEILVMVKDENGWNSMCHWNVPSEEWYFKDGPKKWAVIAVESGGQSLWV